MPFQARLTSQPQPKVSNRNSAAAAVIVVIDGAAGAATAADRSVTPNGRNA